MAQTESEGTKKMLKDKIALVTGASRGIGREIAVHLAKEGAYVIINFSGNENAANETLERIKAESGAGEIYKCNIADFEEVKTMMEYVVKQHGRIDILVNNAGITKDNLLLKMSEQDFDSVIDINLKGAFNTIKNSVRQMLKQKSGRIINISSVSGITGNTGQVNYSSSKAGLIGMTKATAKELASRGITVNAVAPGFIQTDMTEELSESLIETVKKTIPLGHLGDPEDVAHMVVFLASDKSKYITGQIFQVDGGIAI